MAVKEWEPNLFETLREANWFKLIPSVPLCSMDLLVLESLLDKLPE